MLNGGPSADIHLLRSLGLLMAGCNGAGLVILDRSGPPNK